MSGYGFKFDVDLLDNVYLDNCFERIGDLLNARFDKNSVPYSKTEGKIYQFMDVSDYESQQVDDVMESFFDFSFDETDDVQLYRFLVLKNNNKMIILANIHSSIFDNSLIKEVYRLIKGSDDIQEGNVVVYHDDYLKSKDSLSNAHSAEDVNYGYGGLCPLSESQLNIYLDESVKDMGTSYNLPYKIKFSRKYDFEAIKIAIEELFKEFPVLSARVVMDDDVPSFSFDAEPPICVGSLDDISSFVQPFEFDKYLSRFLIIEDGSILCIDCHHLIFDGTSTSILVDRMLEILEDDAVDFFDDGVLRQISFEENIGSQYFDEAEEFFDVMMSDIDEVYELIPSVDGGSDNEVYLSTFDIDSDYLKSFLKAHNTSHNKLFCSVFAYTLSRFSGSQKVFFNLIENGRRHVDLSQSVGMFVRTLPLIINCENQSVDSFLNYSSALINSAMKYDLYSYQNLANRYGIGSSILFQYAHDIYDNFANGNGLYESIEELDHNHVGDLSFFIFKHGENALGIKVEYSSKYSYDLIMHFVESFEMILKDILKVDELSEINYINSSDLKILDSFNQTDANLKYNCVLEAFNDNLAKYSDKNLVLSDDADYTYGQTAYLVNQINSLLKDNDISSDDRVAVFVDRNQWVLATALSCLSSDITYIPIDENYPDKRIAFMIEQSSSKAILTTDTFQPCVNKLVEDFDLELISINISYLAKDVGTSDYVDYVKQSSNEVACILYTSGTTGTPKAVQMTKLGILNLIEFYVESTGFISDDVQGIYASVGFDVSLEQFSSIFTGGSLTYVPNNIKLDIAKLNEYFIRHNVTHTLITTQIAKLFVKEVSETSLKYLQAAGEKLGSIDPPSGYILSDVYGPTEANYISSIDVDKKIDDSSVGMLNWNTKTYILDGEKRRVPFGATGELYLSGYQTTSGYLDNPEANAKALFDNPFDGEIEGFERMYKTGDLARYLSDGSIGIIGRNDSQVKIRGNRVELSEVEVTIRNLDYVDDVTVQTIAHDGNNELVAYVVVNNDLSGEDLRENVQNHVSEYKPEYMIPSFVVKLDKIPVNVNGKVNKRALPEVDMSSLRVEYVAPTNEMEKNIVEAFEKVFGHEKISIYDDFSRLGGDSLTAVKLLTYLADYNITVADILGLRTPYAIARNVKDISMDLDVYSLESGCPLNEPQLNVYLDIIANDKVDSYLIPLYMEISKEYDTSSIEKALDMMFDAHPILGMCCSDNFDVPYLVRGSKPEIIAQHDADDDYVTGFLTKPFDLHDSLCRFLIVDNDDCHALFGVFHHLIFDAISMNVFTRDLQSILDGKSVDIDDSFLKVSAYSQQVQKTEEYDSANDFYELMLADIDEAGILLDSVCSDGPGEMEISLNVDNALFKSFLNDYGISENVLFTSVFAYTLSRFAGSEYVLFSMIENGRDRFKNYDSIGMFVNTLPILVNCEDKAISGFMDYMSGLIYDVMGYNYYPFRLLASKYDIDSNIIFQFLPDWIKGDEGDLSFNYESDLVNEMDDFITDFSVDVIQKGSEYFLKIIYSDKYSHDFVERFINSYDMILQDMLNVNNLSEINYISNTDLEFLNDYNQTEIDLTNADILDAFNNNLEECPDKTLVSFNDISYTYSEGAFIADKIAKALLDLGVKSQDNVAFLVERSERYLLNILGIMSIGAVYVPLDDAYPDNRIQFILEDTKSKVLIVSDETAERGNDLASDEVILNISEILSDEIGALYHLPVDYGDLACILYTSGTTGIPKGVKITRKSILNLSEFYIRKYGLSKDDVYALFASIGFDVAMKAIFPTICAGATLTVVPDNVKLDMKAMNEYFIKYNVTHTEISTQVAKLFISHVDETSLKVLTTGGEKLGNEVIEVDYRFVDSYGPTEACVDVTSIDMEDKIHYSSIGFLLDNIKAYVLDDEFRRVPVGAVGELFLSGNQIAKGYLNRDEETQKAFFDNPFDTGEDYEVMYRTGDIVRTLPDGSIGIVGRRDKQVKIRGNRVELSEVESVIRNVDIVEDTTVQTIKNGNNNELVAYVVVTNDLDGSELKDYICDYVASHKPEYMIPSFVVRLDEIPLTVNGKVNTRALPEVDVGSLHVEYVAPTNDVEKEIVEAFEKVFNQERIGINDDFVRLGGDSLTAIKLLAYLEDYDITAVDILSLHTPSAIAKNLNKLSLDLDVYSLDSGCPLNEPQLNVYLDIVANDKIDSYLIHSYMELSKDYEVQDITDALDEILTAHPILGFCISDEFEVPYLVKGSKPSIIVKQGACLDVIEEFLKRPFDLNDSLSRFLIVETEDGYKLFAVFHHIIFDAISEGVFKQDLRAVLDGKSLAIDDSFLKVSAFNQQIQKSEENVKAKNFYEKLLVDVEEAGIVLDSIWTEGPGFIQHDLDFDSNLAKSFIDKHAITENVLFTSVFAYCLSRFVGSDKVYFNIVENGRDRFRNYDSIGMFVNTLPMFVDCRNQDISLFMEYMSNLTYDVMVYNHYPFRLLANEYNIDSSILFQFIPNWINDVEEEFGSIDYEKYNLLNSGEDFISDLTFELVQNQDNYSLRVEYSDKYSRDFVMHFAESYNLILQEIICKDKLGDINYITNDDIELLDRINLTQHDLDYDDIMGAFNDNLAKCPDNALVSMGDNVYTYSQGAYIADKIASRLTDLGVKSQDYVAFLVDRSESYMFSVLAILSIGGIYVPLDDTHPDERIQFILEDTAAEVVIVSDETMKRAETLAGGSTLLNISDILRQEIGSIGFLPVEYGDLACMLYTSGTTGLPKGVKVTRKSAINVSYYYVDTYHLTNEDIYGLYSSIGFDAASLAILSTICAGACLSIIPADIRLDIHKLNDYFKRYGITQTFITTQVGKLFAKSVDETSLNVLVVGGEKLGDFKSPENYDFVDIYGPTEAFVFVASYHNSQKIDSSSVGNLIYNTKAYILDDEKRKVPVGAVGELYLAGHQIAEGYLNRPDEKAFIDNNPFDGDEEYSRMYRTGDMVRLLPDGTLAVVGRRDNQVKIRGNRVELSEIESVIREIDYVDDITVKTVKNGDNYELVAYVVVSSDLDGNDLRDAVQDYVGEFKPSYMVPSYVIKLDKIPLNVNGKVDKRKLPEITIESKGYESPKDYFEIVIANVFSEVLNIDRPISRNDEFSVLGGDSIAVISLISKLRELNISLTVKDVIDNQSVKKIAEKAEHKMSINNISQESYEGFVETTPNVRYFKDLNLKNPSYFHFPFLLKATKRIDKDVLEESMKFIVNYHDILRAKVKDGKLFVRPQNTEGIFTIEYSNSLDYSSETKRINDAIDIFNGPLIKLLIFQDEEFDYLYVCIHMLLVDSDSIRMIVNDLNFTYTQMSKDIEVDLYNKTSSYRDYAVALNEYKNNEEVLKQKDYWENILSKLRKLPHTEFDSDVIRKRDSFLIRLPESINSILFINIPQYFNCSVRGFFLAMMSKAWNEVMGEDEISVRLNHSGRDNFDDNILTERTVGWLNSFYPVILKCEGKNDKEIIDNIERILDDVPQNGFAYPTLMGIGTDDVPLMNVYVTHEFNRISGGKMFNPQYKRDLADSIAPENNFATDISIMGYTLHNETFINFNYNSERFTREFMEDFGKSFLRNLNNLLSFNKIDYSNDVYVFSNHPDKKKLFFIHSANFGSEYFYYMGQKLRDDYSFIVIEPYNRIHKENQLNSIEEYAKKYIEIIKSIQPEGPYYIGGYCFGGIIAHEIAIQLKKQNEKVDKLIMFESYYIEDDDLKNEVLEEQILYARDMMKDGILNPKHENIEDMISYSLASVNTMYNYKPGHYDGDVIYFKAILNSEGFRRDAEENMEKYFSTKIAGGYEEFYDEEKFKVVSVLAGHDHLLNVEALEVIIPELKKFIDEE